MIAKNEVYERLGTVLDPELRISVVEMGLIRDVIILGNTLEVVYTLTTPACPLASVFPSLIRGALDGLTPNEVKVTLSFDPPWSIEEMSPVARAELDF